MKRMARCGLVKIYFFISKPLELSLIIFHKLSNWQVLTKIPPAKLPKTLKWMVSTALLPPLPKSQETKIPLAKLHKTLKRMVSTAPPPPLPVPKDQKCLFCCWNSAVYPYSHRVNYSDSCLL